ncbi:MAG: efflux RND transporter permease subunit [Hominisplanchenecus sp.]|nr:efflux RND transporter permease subunit [Lachnospiraceae bacterium]MDY2819660.1 efflux RND transporter permease subunit [Hominisplanchenecus sp.]
MLNFGRKIVKFRIPILILSLLLLIPSLFGYIRTRVNYDILYYLPDEIETMQGQDILVDQFGTGAYSMVVCEGMSEKDVSALRRKIEDIDHVEKCIWYDSLMDLEVPMSMLPDKIYDAFNSDDATLMFVIFDTTTSADETMDAIREIRAAGNAQCFVSGMSAIVTDTKDLSDKEVPIYVLIAVLLCIVVLSLTMNSWLVPFLFLFSIGMSILYNLGSNIFLGEVSYITKALTAVLQLGVTMDYSIFLWHSYQEQLNRYPDDRPEAMANAIAATLKSVVASSITTIAGFIALCFMSFTLGLDMGVVMAKGVVIGVICCVTVLPSLIMIFDQALEKTHHRELIPDVPRITEFVTKHCKVFLILFVLLFLPAIYCQQNTKVYYNLDSTLPDTLDSVKANTKLDADFDMGAVHMLLIDSNLSTRDKTNLIKDMEQVDGVSTVLGIESIVGPSVPKSIIPKDIRGLLENDQWEVMLILNSYKTASEEVNRQITQLNTILDQYDPKGMLVGEAPCTKDLITITAKDFAVVNSVSIGLVFLIILLVFKSVTLPILLVAAIELAIYINLGIPYLTGTTLPFIASIVIGTIQLGSTVDYAILMTSRYEKERCLGKSKLESVKIAHATSIRSVLVSALSFFAATFGVGLYSNIDMISSLCRLMARGAIISMFVVLLVIPSMFLVFDKLICKTSGNFRKAAKSGALKL